MYVCVRFTSVLEAHNASKSRTLLGDIRLTTCIKCISHGCAAESVQLTGVRLVRSRNNCYDSQCGLHQRGKRSECSCATVPLGHPQVSGSTTRGRCKQLLSHCSLAIQCSVADSENRPKNDRHIIGLIMSGYCQRCVYTGMSTDSGA
jgi:hypothetical protein